MTKEDLLKNLAETGYNVGFGAKKHFATFDIIDKTPSIIAFCSMAVGIFALVFDALSNKSLSATFIVLGILGVYISSKQYKKADYATAGTKLTQLFNELKCLYLTVKSEVGNDLQIHKDKLRDIENRYYATSISDQILFSDWVAHYKFFWQHQISWISEQRKFGFFRDKVPLSLTILILFTVGIGILTFFDFSSVTSCFVFALKAEG